MKRKLVFLGVILLIAINVSVLATVGYRWKCGQRGKICEGHMPGEYLGQQLSLSDSQKQKMETLRKAFEERTIEIRENLLAKRNELVKLLSEPQPDSTKIESLVKEIGTAQTELEKEVVNHLLHKKEMLTPEQQRKFLDLLKERLFHEGKCEGEIFSPEKEVR
jgi:Spy/CpxP family protein refolding chaperone